MNDLFPGARLKWLSLPGLPWARHKNGNKIWNLRSSRLCRGYWRLSPILFNLVLDEWLTAGPRWTAFCSEEFQLDVMAFADDLVIATTTPAGLQSRLDSLKDFLVDRGLEINPKKSLTLCILPSGKQKKTKVGGEKKFHIGEAEIPSADTTTRWKYLGVTFSARGLASGPLEQDLRNLIQRISKAPLKPQQRLVALKYYTIPRLLHRLILGPVALKLLKKLDRMLRFEVSPQNHQSFQRQELVIMDTAPHLLFHCKQRF